MRIELQPAYVLHTRPYRETSLLLDLLTLDYGRLGAVARGVRRGKSRRRPLLNPFVPLLVSLAGRSSLKTLTGLEPDGPPRQLSGVALYSGFYLNELLVRLLEEQDAAPVLFDDYRRAVAALAGHRAEESPEPLLREFEWRLMEALGYGVSFSREALTGEPLRAGGIYRYDPEAGFVATSADAAGTESLLAGADLLACAVGDWSDPRTLATAKRLNRQMLRPLLGDRPLKSRAFFRTRGRE